MDDIYMVSARIDKRFAHKLICIKETSRQNPESKHGYSMVVQQCFIPFDKFQSKRPLRLCRLFN